jgi:hypothetical protein
MPPVSVSGARRLTPAQVAGFAVGAGFSGAALRTAVAVSFAENGSHDPAALGDTTITNATWGPSVGLWQIRSLKAEYGKGTTRDQKALDNPAFNAKAAYRISNGGKNWTPWSVYTSGAWKGQLAAADAAIAANGGWSGGTVGDPDVPADISVSVPSLDVPGAIANAVNGLLQSIFRAGISAMTVGVAVVLLVLGVVILLRSPLAKAAKGTAKVAGTVAPGGAVAKGAGKVAKVL